MLRFPNLSKLSNELVVHLTHQPPIPTKFPSYIPNFEGKFREDPSNQMMNFNLWCSSYSLSDDTIHLRICQWTLTGITTKWFIELPTASFSYFNSIETTFLNHFQLLVHYETSTKLLTYFPYNVATHISDHMNEWIQR